MKRVLICALAIFLLIPVTMLRPRAEVYSGKALDVEYILTSDEGGVEYPDYEMTDEELAEWEKQQEEEKNNGEVADGGENILDSAAALALAPNYHIQYEADTTAKTLRIYCDPTYKNGQQEMLAYAKAAWIPWIRRADIRKNIEVATIEEGVLTVGHYAFYQCQNLKTVYLPHSVRKVDRTVFYLCRNLETIYYAGTEEDFRKNVHWVDSFNTLDKAGTELAIDRIHFGEHVTVECKNQDGHVFATYTVGGYNVGDNYTITSKTFEGLTLTGVGQYDGKFKKNDKTVYTFTYNCQHDYQAADPEKPCGSYCIHCGAMNPNGVPHTYLDKVISKRGFVSAEEIHHVCTVCGYTVVDTKMAYCWYVIIGAGAASAVGLVSFAIIHPIRKRKKLKDLTW